MKPSDAMEIKYPKPFIAGQLVTVRFEYTVGSIGFSQGGRLRIGLPGVGWAKPEVPQYYFWSEFAQGKDRKYTQYDRVNTTVTLKTQRRATALLDVEARFFKPWSFPPRWLTEYDRYWITVTLEDDGLDAGDKMIVVYGDPEQLPLTARVQGFPEDKLNFMAFADHRGDGNYAQVDGSPWMTEVQAGPASRIQVVAPSIVLPGDRPQVLVAFTDAVHAAPTPKPPVSSLQLTIDGSDRRTKRFKVNKRINSIRLATPRLTSRSGSDPVRITVQDAKRAGGATSNPLLIRSSGPKLFWGDLHAQSEFHAWSEHDKKGISCNTPEDCYRYARDTAGLDFCAVTDTRSISQNIWKETVKQADRMYLPGKFVTFWGSEVGDDVNGHRNLVFRGDRKEGLIDASIPTAKGDGLVELQTPRMQERYRQRADAILIPHHTKMWLNWDCYDPAVEPVMEIYSIWGSGEKAGTDLWEVLREMTGGAQEAWARGYRLGVIAGSDTHAGMPGRSIARCDRDDFMPYKAGFAGVWAEELSRESIFDALRARRCYATTGARIILETFVGRHPMGSEINWPKKRKPRTLKIGIWGTDDLESVTIVKNNQDVRVFSLRKDHATFHWDDKSLAMPGDYYYVRVVQRDGNRAWSSPIWIDIDHNRH